MWFGIHSRLKNIKVHAKLKQTLVFVAIRKWVLDCLCDFKLAQLIIFHFCNGGYYRLCIPASATYAFDSLLQVRCIEFARLVGRASLEKWNIVLKLFTTSFKLIK